MRLTEKRAKLYREWLLATIANHESYYLYTIMTGIPDGDSMETVMNNLETGEYDDDITEMLATYEHSKRLFGKYGYCVSGKVIYDENEALQLAGFHTPTKIYKRKSDR